MEIVEIDRREAQILAAPVERSVEELGRQGMTTGDEIVRRRRARGHEASFGGNEDLATSPAAVGGGARDGAPDRPLAPLSPIVDRGVENVDPAAESDRGGFLETRVGFVVFGTEVAAEADRREGESIAHLAEMAGSGCDAFRERLRVLGARPSFDHSPQPAGSYPGA